MSKKYISKYLSQAVLITIMLSFYGCNKIDEKPVLNEIDSSINKVDKSKIEHNEAINENIEDDKSIIAEDNKKESDVEEDKLSEEKVREITILAKTALNDIISVLNFDSNTVISESGKTYAVSNNYKNKEAIIEALSDYYTEEAINNFITNQTIEKNELLYIVYGQGGIGLSIADDDIDIEETDNKCIVIFTKKIEEDFIVRQQYEFVKINGKWLRSDITLYS